MKHAEIVKQFVEALEARDMDRAASYLSDDFRFGGLTSPPMGGDQFLEVQRALLVAFPDWSVRLTDMKEDAGVVVATAHVTGTHTGDLVLPVPDLPAVPATGKAISLPGETHLYTVRGGKIASLHILLVPGGGFQGMYRQLGVQLPVPSAIKG